MFIPLRTDSPLHSTPWVNRALIAANVLAYLAQARWPGILENAWQLNPRDPHLVNYLTYAFLHGGIIHLLGNLLALYIFGNNVNDRLGQVGYLAFYLAGAVAAGVGFVALTSESPVIGASGAIGAVMGAYLVLLPRSNITIFYMFVVAGSLRVPGLVFILTYFAFNVAMHFLHDATGGVAYEAHIAGMLFGFAVTFGLLLAGLLPRTPGDVLTLLRRPAAD